ncbi:EcsC family protein [Methylobacter sp.]|uniref:EcsC family protein n=1 Tax=Methylobacter sp. TaxID=2051955 RepID=UPI0025DBC778|nr:EcsC family protein [Methylobacter sp.]
MNENDVRDLKKAVRLLENPSIGAKIAGIVGISIEKSIALLPNKATQAIDSAAQKAIYGALRLSLRTLEPHNPRLETEPPKASNGWHIAATAVTGAIGGAFGLLALTVELPISTTIMMRSIADVARSEGADLKDLQTQLECVQVLAFGGPTSNDDAAEIGYFVAREAMTKAVSEAAAHIAKSGLQKESAPAIVRLITKIADRYSISVTEKAGAQLVPALGAVGGALINTVFIDHFQDMARGHFTIRRLEKQYSHELVRQKYLEFKQLIA